MRTVAALFLSFFALAPVDAKAQEVVGVEIVEYGIYTAGIARTYRDAATGVLHSTLNEARHVEATRTVPAELGVRFGFRFVVTGTPKGEPVTLRKVTHYPPAGVRAPKIDKALTQSEQAVPTSIGGQVVYTDYGFDDSWELVPGSWRIELWYQDRRLTSQEFTVVKP